MDRTIRRHNAVRMIRKRQSEEQPPMQRLEFSRSVDSDVRQIRDEDGIWTGARKCNITLRRDPAGTIKHLPSTIMLGNNRGQVFYYGLVPKEGHNRSQHQRQKTQHHSTVHPKNQHQHTTQKHPLYRNYPLHQKQKLRPALLGNLPVIVAGDFNCALRDLDRSRPRNDGSSRELIAIINEHQLQDLGRDLVPRYTWMVKERTKHFYIKAGKTKARCKKEQLTKLNRRLQNQTELQQEGFNLSTEIAVTKHKLALIHRQEQQKIKYTSKIKHLEDDEKCTKYFFQHIRRKKQTIDTLKDHTQTPQTDEHTITDIITDFYTNLYATKSTDDDLINGLLQHIIPVPDKEEEGDLTLEELTRAMRSLSTGKTPGPDGLPAEFYITFWEHLKVCLGAVYNSMYREGKLAPSMTESAVTLLYKGKGDATELRNWRPISLLGSDYKILAKTLIPFVFSTLTRRRPSTGTNPGRRSWKDALAKVKKKIAGWQGRSLTMTGKVLVIKAIVYPILAYIGKVFPPNTHTARHINKTIYNFIWGSDQERVNRLTMWKKENKGGKGIPNIPLYIAVQGLSYIISNIRRQHNKAGFFHTFYFSTIIRPLGLCTLDHRTPYSWDPPLHYKALKSIITSQQLHTHKSQDWSFKTLRKFITDRDTVTPIPTLTTEQCTTAWTNIASPALMNRHTDIAWMAAIRCLPTRHFMHKRGIARTDQCPHGCREIETEDHILWRCRVAKNIWLMTSALLTRLTGTAATTLRGILFGPPGGLQSPQERNAWRVVNATKQTIWDTRNIKVFHKQDTLPIITARIIRKTIIDYITLDTHRLGQDITNRQWNISTPNDIIITPPVTNLPNPTTVPPTTNPNTSSRAGIMSRHLALDPSYSRAKYWTFHQR
ncbi:uncharacterized protein LOC117594982 [Esox lucius]|uniref:uncharacterized protein LOC117594982 n=1 Tax=Esox lucius TaxID=8010 RepID=UPI001476ECCF|nr:uncharacterized protein LOC117594982 [Esox lucius]